MGHSAQRLWPAIWRDIRHDLSATALRSAAVLQDGIPGAEPGESAWRTDRRRSRSSDARHSVRALAKLIDAVLASVQFQLGALPVVALEGATRVRRQPEP